MRRQTRVLLIALALALLADIADIGADGKLAVPNWPQGRTNLSHLRDQARDGAPPQTWEGRI